jgi:hypothetical protein
MTTTARNTRTANGSTPRITSPPTRTTTHRGVAYATTSRRGKKPVKICYDHNMQRIKCPSSVGGGKLAGIIVGGGKLAGIIVGVVVGVAIIAFVLYVLYLRRKAKRARADTETPEEKVCKRCGDGLTPARRPDVHALGGREQRARGGLHAPPRVAPARPRRV